MRRRALVTGGAGFLGSHLCDRLLADGWAVFCIDNLLTGDLNNVAHLGSDPHFRFIEADATLPARFADPLGAVLHFASPASPIDYLRFPIETLRVGSVGTLECLELAKQHGARFMLASTSETYGDPLVHPQSESYWGHVNPVGPRSVYDEAKRFAEAATMAYRRYHGVDAGIVRIFNTYGPRMRRNDGRAIPSFICQALSGVSLTVAGDGRQTRSVCYVEDLVDGLHRFLEKSHAGPVNIGSPNELSMLDLATTVLKMTGSHSPIRFIPRPEDDPMVRRPDISLAEELLGWSPRVGLEEGLARTIQWFRDQGTSVV
jgi:dTDP-glucose 4,6-dehydratase